MYLFDFNFYYGDIVGKGSSGMLEFIKSIFAVGFGFFLARGYEWFMNKKKINSAGEDLINEIHFIEQPIEIQIASINNSIKILKEAKTVNPSVNFMFSLNTERVNFINRTDILKYYEKHVKDRFLARQKLNNIFTSLEIITFNARKIQTLNDNFFEEVNVKMDNYEEAFGSIHRKIINTNNDIARNSNTPSDFIVEITLLWQEHFGDAERVDILQKTNSFHDTLMDILKKHHTDIGIDEFLELNQKCMRALNDIIDLKNALIVKLQIIIEGLSTHKELLLKNIKYFETK